MTEYRTDAEQVQQIKNWWKTNGSFTTIVVVLGIAAYFGGDSYIHQKHATAENASYALNKMLEEVQLNKGTEAKQLGESLVKSYPQTQQASQAALVLAKLAVEANDFNGAKQWLIMVKDQAPVVSLQILARIRLARVMSELNETDQALSMLDVVDPGEFRGMLEEVRGDIYLAKGDLENARLAFTRALTADPMSIRQSQLQMKLDDLNKAKAQNEVG